MRMTTPGETHSRLARIDGLSLLENEPLALHTRFALGGPVPIFADTGSEDAFVSAVAVLSAGSAPWTVVGEGSNLVVSDQGYDGIVLRYRGAALCRDGDWVTVQSGATLQSLVDFTVQSGLEGLDRMSGIPGFVGAAIYGNAGAYGQSTSDTLESLRFLDRGRIREFSNAECKFRYRESIFKRRKDWLLLSAVFHLKTGDAAALKSDSDEILATRNRKFPPDMRCAGSVFKNLLLNELSESVRAQVPETVVKKGKVPAAWFLEQVGARGLRHGGIHVADYHANLIYNAGGATAAELRDVLNDLKRRVFERFGLQLEEEVQFLGFEVPALG
jgi:UDP-N-acetylmuramate dehydrogenase